MCDCSICNCPGCRKARRDAGFIDSGPYAPLAAARWDQLGPGVYETTDAGNWFTDLQEKQKRNMLTGIVIAGLALYFLSGKR